MREFLDLLKRKWMCWRDGKGGCENCRHCVNDRDFCGCELFLHCKK